MNGVVLIDPALAGARPFLRRGQLTGRAGYHELLAANEVGVVLAGQDTMRVLLSGDTSVANLTNAINRGASFKFPAKPWSDLSLTGVLESAWSYYAHF